MTPQVNGHKKFHENSPQMNEEPTMGQLYSLEKCDGGSSVRIIERIGADNHELGTKLLRDNYGAIMRTIIDDARGDNEKVIIQIFNRWLSGSGAPVSWKVLVYRMRDVKRLKALADEIVDCLNSISVNDG